MKIAYFDCFSGIKSTHHPDEPNMFIVASCAGAWIVQSWGQILNLSP